MSGVSQINVCWKRARNWIHLAKEEAMINGVLYHSKSWPLPRSHSTHICWEPFPRVTFQTLNTWTACHQLITTNAGGSSDFSEDPWQHQSTVAGSWGGGSGEELDGWGEWVPIKWLAFSLWKACLNFHNWHGPTVRTCTLSPLLCSWVYVLCNLVCQAIITGPPAAPVAPGSSLETQIPDPPQELLKSESVFWQDPGWLVASFNGQVWFT